MIVDIKKKRLMFVVYLVSLVAVLFFMGQVAYMCIEAKDYKVVSAKIEGITKETNTSASNFFSITRYVVYTYKLKQGGAEYTSQQRVFSLIGKNIGDFKKIKVDQKEPNTVFNTNSLYGYVIGVLFFSIIAFMLKRGLCRIREIEKST